ncbi:MAG: efflux RND transporter permease subunit [Burkholderiaceae bacterium]
MNISKVFITRPVATTLLTVGVALAGMVGFRLLPVSPLPQVDFPTISVQATLPGASPETMAATVATPLERALGRIAGITEMTSSSSLGSTRITIQFDLSRDIDGAARDTQAAINAARALLPTGLPSNPTYRKVNPADAPIMILALTSDTMSQGQLYDAADSVVAQELSQVQGVGQVTVGGSSKPSVRVELNPDALNKYGIGTESVRNVIAATNANRPKGQVEQGDRYWQIYANDQANTAKEYEPLIIDYNNGAPVRLRDIASVVDSVADLRNAGFANGRKSVLVILNRSPGANIIETVDRVTALLPQIRASIPAAINLDIVLDRTPTIRASLRDVERTLATSVGLVILVVFLFLRSGRATLIPSVAVPISLIGTFAIMYLLGYSLDNLSLMALTIATGFVVDDAIVVLENVSRYIEYGMKPFDAAVRGVSEVGFTVLSMSLSLIAVFIPILLMGGLVGRLFREFAVTLSVAILVSLVVSLTTTPMMCARLLRERDRTHRPNRLFVASEAVFDGMLRGYRRSLAWALRHAPFMAVLTVVTVCLNVYLYIIVPKGFFPQQDTGRIIGFIQADQSISFQFMVTKLGDFMRIVGQDPLVDSVIGFTGGGQRNTGQMFISLKPLAARDHMSSDQVIGRLRGKLAKEPGATLYLQSVQDLRVGGRQSNAQYQFTLQADDLDELALWEPKVRQALTALPELVDVNTDQQDKGLQTSLLINRDQASRLLLNPSLIDATLNDLYGQREVSTIYEAINQYYVVMEAAPQYWQRPAILENTYISVPYATNLAQAVPTFGSSSTSTSTSGLNPASTFVLPSSASASGATQSGNPSAIPTSVPLSGVATYFPTNTALAVNHQEQFVASTISFNLPPGVSIGQASDAIQAALARLGVPTSVHGSFQGTAKVFQASLSTQPILILTALLTVYIVLGILYESYVHPITILSTLPSAGVGALLALLVTGTEFSLIALIGVILLIGIVKKNAIMMIDFALAAERNAGLPPSKAIYRACILRFRPIMMTTMAALFGAIPLALGAGDGAELRKPLGISIVGGLIMSQLLTLYTTPVIYLYLDRARIWVARRRAMRRGRRPGAGTAVPAV